MSTRHRQENLHLKMLLAGIAGFVLGLFVAAVVTTSVMEREIRNAEATAVMEYCFENPCEVLLPEGE